MNYDEKTKQSYEYIYKSNLTDVWDLGDVSDLKVPK